MNTCDLSRQHVIATMRRSLHSVTPYLAAIALSMGLALAGCGHQDSAAEKTTASYQGKPDTEPWNNNRWHDNRETWERAISAREQGQNEYVRIPQ
jgi:hypothetical protein